MEPTINDIRQDDGTLPAYAWPGGYPILYVADDCQTICPKCVNTEDEIHFDGDGDGWRIDAWFIHYEGAPEYCAHCNETTEIFSAGGGEAAARKFNTTLLGQIPLDPAYVQAGDNGTPPTITDPSCNLSKVMARVGEQVAAAVGASPVG